MNLAPLDLFVFAAYTALLLGIGLYFTRKQKSLKTFLVANQNMHWIVVGVSVLAALFSGITYLGAPAESFFHDLTYLWAVAALFIATPITTIVFLPVFRRSDAYTAYEFLEKRFDRRLRYLASGMFILRTTFYLGVAIYAPALAIMEVTGWPLWLAVVLTGASATLYTSLGGMQAVIWTDTIQFVVLCGGIVLIIAVAAAKIPGGLFAAWHVAAGDGKTNVLHLSPNPAVRLTLWNCLLGGAANALVQMVTDQISVQRYLTAPTLKDSRRALWFKLWVAFPLIAMFYLTGTVLYAYYRVTPAEVPALRQAALVPALAQPVEGATTALQGDRILPYFVMHTLPSPLRGLLIAALFGATIAVVSAGIHALGTTALIDWGRPATEGGGGGHSLLSARLLTFAFGAIASVLAIAVIPLFGTIIQAGVTVLGLFGGPLLGVFFLGALSHRATGFSALLGAFLGAVVGVLIAFSEQLFATTISFMWISFASATVTYVTGECVGRLSRTKPST